MSTYRLLRCFLWFVCGLFLGGYAVFANAGSPGGYTTTYTGSTVYLTPLLACSYAFNTSAWATSRANGWAITAGVGGNCQGACIGYVDSLCKNYQSPPYGLFPYAVVPAVCDSPQVLDVATNTCKDPAASCIGDQHLDPDSNTCKCTPALPTTQSYQASTPAGSTKVSDPPTCSNGCSKYYYAGVFGSGMAVCTVNPGSVLGALSGGALTYTCWGQIGTSGNTCVGNGTTAGASPPLQITLAPGPTGAAPAGTNSLGVADPLSTSTNNGDPAACAAAGGAYAQISGIGYCNSATPSAPSVQQKIAVASSTDPTTGITTTTTNTTTTTCTGPSACSSVTNTTTNVGGNVTNTGQVSGSGTTPGGSIAAAGKPAAGSGAVNFPTDYQRDATGQTLNVMTDVIKTKVTQIRDVIGDPAADDSAITGAKATDAAQKDLDDADKKFKDAMQGQEDSGVTSAVSQWQAAMSSGWWTPIPSSSCAPFSAKIGPWNWTLNICETAAKISEIGGYCMWVMLMFSGFLLLTTPQSYKWM